jgi:hypothetical protein
LAAIAVEPANAQAPLGSVAQFTATAIMSDDTRQDVTKAASWSASGAASISATGVATGNALGTARISASVQNISGSTTWMILPGTRSRFIRTTFPSAAAFNINSAVYDPVRKLIFVNNIRENTVDVIAGPDYHLAASIPVPFPIGLDLTADGTQLLVCSQQSIVAIDPDTLRVVGKTPVPPTLLFSVPINIFTTSTGNAFLVMGNITSTGSELVEWYPSQGKFVEVRTPNSAFDDGAIVRSQDHRKLLMAVGSYTVDLYDSASDQFTASYTGSYPELGYFPNLAANPDGTQFIAGIDVLDSTLAKIGSLQSRQPLDAAIYSRDGSRIYSADTQISSFFNVVDSSTFAVIGKAPNIGTNGKPLGIDETGMLIEWFEAGLALVDVSKSQPLANNSPVINAVQPPQGILGQMNPTTIKGGRFNSVPSVWFGSSFAPETSVQDLSTLQVIAPPLFTFGPVNVTTTFPDGSFAIAPDAFSIGPHVLEMLTDGGSTAGGTAVELLGYGFQFDASQVQVTVGGQPATVTSVFAPSTLAPFIFPVHHLKFTTPPGPTGEADVTIQTPAGATTLARGFKYVDAQSFSNGNVYSQVVYDRSRQNLYLGTVTGEIDVFSLTQKQFVATVNVGGKVASMALAPDASRLLIANSGDDSIDLIDLSTNAVTRVTATDGCFLAGTEPQEVVVTSLNKAFITVNNINFLCPAPFTNLRQLDLDSLAITNRDIGGTTFITEVNGMAATPDGSQVVMTILDSPDAIWHSSSDTFFTKRALQGLPAIDADGTIIAMNSAVLDMQFQSIGYAAPSGIASAYEPFVGVFNEQLNPTGSMLYSTDGNRIDLYDTGHGTRRRKIAAGPSTVSVFGPATNAFAVDETGLRIFTAISGKQASGFVALALDSLPLAIGTVNPAQASAFGGTLVTIRGSGFQAGATVGFNDTVVPATWIDQNTLTATTPPVTAGFVRVTVTNPNQERFSLDTAFQAN